MEYINVSQFYESILCFSIPLLIIQKILLCCFDLSGRYEDYRRMFYEDQFKFTKEYQFAVEEPSVPPPQPTIKDEMLQKRDNNQEGQKKDNQIQVQHVEEPSVEQNRSRIHSFNSQNGSLMKPQNEINIQRVNKITIDLQTDKELKNSINIPTLQRQIKDEQPSQSHDPKFEKKPTSGKQQIFSQSDAEYKHQQHAQQPKKAQQPQKTNKAQHKIHIQQIQQSRMSRLTHSDIEVRRQTQLDDQMEKPYAEDLSERANQKYNKQVIQIGRGKLQQQGQLDKVRLKYCRRVDDAFNDYIPVVMSVVVLGILTKSVYIYSMCCFFGYAFSSLLFNYIHLLDRLEGINTQTVFGRANQLVSSLFIIGLFISYWVSDQFYYG